MQEIKQTVSKKEIDGTVKRVKYLQNGGILLGCQTDTQQRKLKENLSKKKQFDIKEIQNSDPMLLFAGIIKGSRQKNL